MCVYVCVKERLYVCVRARSCRQDLVVLHFTTYTCVCEREEKRLSPSLSTMSHRHRDPVERHFPYVYIYAYTH